MTDTPEKLSFGETVDRIHKALEALPEDQRKLAVGAVLGLLGIDAPKGAPTSLPPTPTESATPIVDIKSFKEQKEPKNAIQMACVAAFYFQELAPEADRKMSVTTADMQSAFRQAKFPLPTAARMLLPSAKKAGYFDSPGTGSYRLNAVGYNLVAYSLPLGEADTPKKKPWKKKVK
jgi:hypothetical protein